MDFTLKTYQTLLQSLIQNQYHFLTFHDYILKFSIIENSIPQSFNLSTSQQLNNSTFQSLNFSIPKLSIMRHDVDRLPQNALSIAKIENTFGIKGTYYFRIVPESFDLKIMQSIAELGHEIGYHYEDVDLVLRRLKSELRTQNGKIDENKLIDVAYESFCNNLELLRKHFDIKTICMHGSPHSKFDNRIIWKKYSYKKLGIIGEPYFDIDYNQFAYFTDTGRRWNGRNVSIRDKVNSKYNFDFRTTMSIIKNIEILPDKLIINIHSHRWFNLGLGWFSELIFQNVKNLLKYYIKYGQ